MSAWRSILFFSLLCLFMGFVFLLVQRKWIIIQLPFGTCSVLGTDNQPIADRVTTNVYFYANEKWCKQEATLVCSAHDKQSKLRQITKHWLAIMKEKQLINAHVVIESAVVSSTGSDAYVSFDRGLFVEHMSIIEKWMVIESLLRTFVAASLSLQTIQFFVHHKPMRDDHIQLSQAIPVQVFLAD